MDHTKRLSRTLAGFGLTGHGENNFYVFWKYWKLTSSPNTSKLVLGPPDWSSDSFIARVPSQELSNKLTLQQMTPNKICFPENWRTSQNHHLLIKWLPFLCLLLSPLACQFVFFTSSVPGIDFLEEASEVASFLRSAVICLGCRYGKLIRRCWRAVDKNKQNFKAYKDNNESNISRSP